MYCGRCGELLSKGVKFCTKCGMKTEGSELSSSENNTLDSELLARISKLNEEISNFNLDFDPREFSDVLELISEEGFTERLAELDELMYIPDDETISRLIVIKFPNLNKEVRVFNQTVSLVRTAIANLNQSDEN